MKQRKDPLATACKALEEDLVLYYYDELDPSQKGRMEQHLGGCGDCRRFVEDLRRLLPQLAAPQELPQSFWDGYYRQTVAKLAERQEQKYWWRKLIAPVRMWMIPAFGSAAVAVLALGMILGKGNLDHLYHQSQERIPREIAADTEQLEFFRSLDMLESLKTLERLEGVQAEAHSV